MANDEFDDLDDLMDDIDPDAAFRESKAYFNHPLVVAVSGVMHEKDATSDENWQKLAGDIVKFNNEWSADKLSKEDPRVLEGVQEALFINKIGLIGGYIPINHPKAEMFKFDGELATIKAEAILGKMREASEASAVNGKNIADDPDMEWLKGYIEVSSITPLGGVSDHINDVANASVKLLEKMEEARIGQIQNPEIHQAATAAINTAVAAEIPPETLEQQEEASYGAWAKAGDRDLDTIVDAGKKLDNMVSEGWSALMGKIEQGAVEVQVWIESDTAKEAQSIQVNVSDPKQDELAQKQFNPNAIVEKVEEPVAEVENDVAAAPASYVGFAFGPSMPPLFEVPEPDPNSMTASETLAKYR